MSNKPVMSPNGINHLAIATSDMKKVLQYFNQVLGMPLASLYWMHGVENTVHGFLVLNETSLLAFVANDQIKSQVDIGVTHSGNPGDPCAGGTMQHLAFNVDRHEDLLAVRDRIRANGIHCVGPMDHGLMQSIYFAGPDGMTLEVAYLSGEDPAKWIDPEVVKMLNISDEELDQLKKPAPFVQPAEPVPNPSLKTANEEYRMVYPQETYELMVNTPDDVLAELTKDNIPPTETDGPKAPPTVEDLQKLQA
ncbi:hypothetical protein R50073_13320 [Maricurvus nonylphenolicus]|uniref:VOC family protein n=1 Tax=Maricurvus nonylphenolicus TaxID=1008307 RepID=UPI0036F420FF